MTSTERALINRQNSQHSTGPRTAEGKAICAANPIQHGLRSARIVIDGEDEAEYQASVQRLIEQNQPACELELALVNEIAAAHWRLQRSRNLESDLLAQMAQNAEAEGGLLEAFTAASKQLDIIRRYMTSIERAWYKAMNTLRQMQKDVRKIREAAAAAAGKAVTSEAKVQRRIQKACDLHLKSMFEALTTDPDYLRDPAGSARQTLQNKRDRDQVRPEPGVANA